MVAKTEKKDEKTSLGSKILDYVPWRMALTVAAFAIPVVGPVAGTAIGAFTYGNYRQNNRTENPASNNEPDNKESKKERQPGRLERLASQAGTIAKRIGVIAIGFLFGGPIGGIIATGLMVVDGISGGKLIQGVEKALDAGYDTLIWAKDKVVDAGKWALDKMKGSEKGVEKEGKPIHSFENPDYFPEAELKDDGKEVGKAEQPAQGGKAEAELRRRESSADQGAARG
ncbi:hypothetical protein GOM44_06055 [Wolbachia endosymbiont of Atemnus politus]|uniref:hypothetical protein n=1 Tax=Wolbachia endosymbiont of Atemnus politus TaxID=2682840 RepID=UPI001572863C|nr:hypothetical protein [Wolbachia endosymbiont of Atemnus politus]NSX83773.1 hypothetical protein [Wolbachia endosymbiont of Atemnus politus]